MTVSVNAHPWNDSGVRFFIDAPDSEGVRALKIGTDLNIFLTADHLDQLRAELKRIEGEDNGRTVKAQTVPPKAPSSKTIAAALIQEHVNA